MTPRRRRSIRPLGRSSLVYKNVGKQLFSDWSLSTVALVFEEIQQGDGLREVHRNAVSEHKVRAFFEQVNWTFLLAKVANKRPEENQKDQKKFFQSVQNSLQTLLESLQDPRIASFYKDISRFEGNNSPAISELSRNAKAIRNFFKVPNFHEVLECVANLFSIMRSEQVEFIEILKTGPGFLVRKKVKGRVNRAILKVAVDSDAILGKRYPTMVTAIFNSATVREIYGHAPLKQRTIVGILERASSKEIGLPKKKNPAKKTPS